MARLFFVIPVFFFFFLNALITHKFSQIIGGLTWCIDNCNVDLDIDLHFDESLVIGQKM